MLRSYLLHSFLALSISTIFDLAQSKLSSIAEDEEWAPYVHENIPEAFLDSSRPTSTMPKNLRLENGYWVLDVSPQGQLPMNKEHSSTSSAGQKRKTEEENGGGSENLGGRLAIETREQILEDGADLLNSRVNHPELSRPSRGIDNGKISYSVKQSISLHRNLPDDIEKTRDNFKALLMNTDNLYVLFSQKPFRNKKSWVPYSRAWLSSLRPYKNFMGNVGSVMGKNRNKSMAKFLLSLAHLRIEGFEKFSISETFKFMRYKKFIVGSLGLGCEALKDRTLVYVDRLRVIGIIQYLKDYLPQNSNSLEEFFGQHSLSFQSALELFFTRDIERAVEVEIEAPFTKQLQGSSVERPFDFAGVEVLTDVRECFARAAFMSGHEDSLREGLLEDLPQGIHLLTVRYLLGSGLPKDVKTIKKLTSELQELISGNTLTIKERNYANAVVSHLWAFPIYRQEIDKLLRLDKFITNFLKPKAQDAIESFLGEKEDYLENGKEVHQMILGLLENKLPPSHKLVQSLLDEMKTQTLDIDEKVKLLRLLNAKSVIQPELRPIVLEKIYHDQTDLHVSEVWSYIGSRHPISQTPLDDLDTMAFKLYPALLTSSYRRVLGAKLQAQENEDMKLIGESLANLPRHMQPDAGPKSQELRERMEHILSTVSDAEQHFGCFEVYLHLLWYNPMISVQLLNSMVQKDRFNDNILFFANKVLSSSQDTSGIAGLQLNVFSQILKKIYWEIMNSGSEGRGSESISPQRIQWWAQQLYPISPI